MSISAEQLAALAAEAPTAAPAGTDDSRESGEFDIGRWIAQYLPDAKPPTPYRGGRRWILASCPFYPEHRGTSVAVIEMKSGALVFKCQHDSCKAHDWHALRAKLEPGYRVRAASRNGAGPEEAPPHGDDEAPRDTKRGKTRHLWERWIKAVAEDNGQWIWADTEEAFLALPTGDVLALRSQAAAYYFQGRTDREAYHGSQKWARAVGAVSAYALEKAGRARVFRQAKIDWTAKVAWIGCEDGKHLYRVTPDTITLEKNGTAGVLIAGGCAPVLSGAIAPTGALVNWLSKHTWATPVAKLLLTLLSVMMMLGADAYDARPLTVGKGEKGSGKTTTLQILGCIIFGKLSIAQAIKNKEEENESRVLNEPFPVFDNIDAQTYGYSVEDFLATACTQQRKSIRKMRAEGEVVEKSVIAFVGATSYTLPPCLKRPDVMERAVILEFQKPKDGKTGKLRARIPDRAEIWCDLLALLQRALRRWDEVPETSDIRAIEFVQIGHALLPKASALALEQSILRLQLRTAALDDPILEALESNLPPPRPMTAKELLDYLWPVRHDWRGDPIPDASRPKSPTALGVMLSKRVGKIGGWCIRNNVTNTTGDRTEWSFTRTGAEAAEAVLTDIDAAALLQQYFVPGDSGSLRAVSEESPTPDGPDVCACTGDSETLLYINTQNGGGKSHPGDRKEERKKTVIDGSVSESPVRHEPGVGDSSETLFPAFGDCPRTAACGADDLGDEYEDPLAE